MENSYLCAHCGGTFPKGWTDEEAFAERDRDFSKAELEAEGQAVVCDDCYQRFTAWLKLHPEERLQWG